jgi:hypothetical protein
LLGELRRRFDRAMSTVGIVGCDENALYTTHRPLLLRRSCFKLMM